MSCCIALSYSRFNIMKRDSRGLMPSSSGVSPLSLRHYSLLKSRITAFHLGISDTLLKD